MNIASTGPKGYEYQYLATVFVALQIGLDDFTSLVVEKKGSEDAILQINKNSESITIEIQVKRENSTLDISKLSNWLTHFQEGIADNNLLLRLTGTDELALFITTSRCNDDTVHLRTDIGNIRPHLGISISKAWNAQFMMALSNYSDNTKKLEIPRKTFCASQATNFSNKASTSDVLKRVLVWEEVSDENIVSAIESLLNREYTIPQSQVNSVLLLLLEIVREGRDKGIEVIRPFQQLVARKKASAPVLDPKYKKRPEEDSLFQDFKLKNVLLLTGSSLCGKSELAKQIALRFVFEGYNYSFHTDLLSIVQFLAQNPSEDKIAILEDPWGHLEKSTESLDMWKRIESFSGNLPPHHKLIITSRREIIESIYPKRGGTLKQLGNHHWYDLTLSDTDFLIDYWRNISQERGLSVRVIQLIEKQLQRVTGEEKLQIGQLKYLAGSDLDDLDNKTLSELEHIARMNSEDIAENIKNKDHEAADLLSLLALTSTTAIGVSKVDLAYILGEDQKLYSKTDKGWWQSGGRMHDAQYPAYDQELVLPESILAKLEYLERRFFIVEENNNLLFTHPNYFEVGRYLFANGGVATRKKFLNKIQRALFALHPETAFLVSNQFSFLAKKFPSTEGELIHFALEGLNSIYPAVEDKMVIFLIEFLNQLNDEQREILISNLEDGGTPSSHIFWFEKSIPFIDPSHSHFSDIFSFKVDEQDFTNIENSLDRNDSVSSYDAWQYLQGVRYNKKIRYNKKKSMSSRTLETLLQYREVFLRRPAAYFFIVENGSSLHLKDIKRIFSDEHPSIVFEGIKGCFAVWNDLPSATKEKLDPLLAGLMSKKTIAIRANKLMTTFAKDDIHNSIDWHAMDEEEKKELWQLWGKLFPIFIGHVPYNVALNTGRFGLTMETSLKYLDHGSGMKVLEAWYHRIDNRIKNKSYPDEYEMAIADDLMTFTKGDYASRTALIEKLLSYHNTNFLISNIKWIVSHWSNLDVSEKSIILSLINSKRQDVSWIKAVLLNTYQNPTSEIQVEILGDSSFFDLPAKDAVDRFPEALLMDCLKVYFGHPQPLRWLAVHNHNIDFWSKIVKYILYHY